MPGEPLIFVEVALMGEVPGSIQLVLDPERGMLEPERATTAVFYSISNCQAGLAGVSFGAFLIKQVAGDLARFGEVDRRAAPEPPTGGGS
jgi:malonyl-CoA decarboxylase